MDENKKDNSLIPDSEETKNSEVSQTPEASEEPVSVVSETEEHTEEASEQETTNAALEEKLDAFLDDPEDDVEDELKSIVDMPAEENKPAKPKKSHKKFWRIFSIILVAVLVICGAAYLIIDPMTAVTVGKNKVSIMEFEYYYKSNVSDFVNNYGSYYSIDASKDLSKQECPLKNDDGSSVGTWHDFFMLQTKEQLTLNYAIYDEAKANKETLSSEDTNKIEENLKEIKDTAKSAGQSMNEYCKENYGFKMNERVWLKILRVNTLAANYYNNKFSPAKDYSDKEIEEYYNKNKDTLDSVSIRNFVIPIDTDKENGDAQAKAKANKMLAAIKDEASFIAQAKANASKEDKERYASDSATLLANVTKADAEQGSFPEDVMEWAFNRSRKAGDKIVLTDGSYYFVLYLVHPLQKDTTPQVDMRHILISPETDSDSTTATDAQKKAARKKAEELYKQWVDGGKNMDTFTKLAKENSDDSQNASNGGLIEGVKSGDFVEPMNKWLFDAARKPGDSTVLDTEYGSHIVYYVKQGKPNWMVAAQDAMNTEAKNKAQQELIEQTKYKLNKIGIKFADFSMQS